MENKKVSAIITTYKRDVDVLKRAINSVLNQTYKNIEIIVVNDYPDDKKLESRIYNYLKSLKLNNLRYVCHDKNYGACKARNTGIKLSKGYYIAFLDDDDEWIEDKIELMVNEFVYNNVGLVYSNYYLCINNKISEVNFKNNNNNIFNELLCENVIGGTSMPLILKECLDNCGLFDEKLLSSQDYDMWIRISQKYTVKFINKPLTKRYLLNESITTNIEKKKQGWEMLNKKYEIYYNNNKYIYNIRMNNLTDYSFTIGEFKYGFNFYKKAVNANIFSLKNIISPCRGIIKFIIGRRFR